MGCRMTKWERRCRRESQQKYGKLGPSPATILENTQVVLCVAYGLATEEEGAKALRMRVDEFHKLRASVILLARIVSGNLAEESPCQPN